MSRSRTATRKAYLSIDEMAASLAADDWLAIGIAKGFCSEPFCGTRDWPLSDNDDDLDNCHIVVSIRPPAGEQ